MKMKLKNFYKKKNKKTLSENWVSPTPVLPKNVVKSI